MDNRTPRSMHLARGLGLLVWLALLVPSSAQAQDLDLPHIGEEKLTAYAQAFLGVSAVRDEVHAQLAHPANKNPEAQARLRDEMRERVSAVLDEHGFGEEEYDEITFVLSVDEEQREAFEMIVARLEGRPADTDRTDHERSVEEQLR